MRAALLLLVPTLPACHQPPPAAAPTLEVRVEAPHRTSDEMEGATKALERTCSRVAHLAHLHGLSQEGVARVTVELEPGANVDAALGEVQQSVREAETTLPPGAGPVTIAKGGGRIVRRYAWSSQVLSMGETDGLRRPAWIVPLSRTAGVASIASCGGATERVVVELDAYRLAAMSVTVTDVVAALSKAPLSAPGARSALPPLVLAVANGTFVRLQDVASLRDEAAARACRAYDERGPVAEDIVRGVTGGDLRAIGDATDAQLRTTVGALPPGIDVHPVTVTREITADLDPAVDPRAYGRLHEVLTSVPGIGRFLLEIGSADDAETALPTAHVLLESGAESVAKAVARALAQLPFVRSCGEPNATVKLIGADRAALRAAEEDLLQKLTGHAELVVRLGGSEGVTQTVSVDEDRARKLGMSLDDVRLAIAARRGQPVGETTVEGRSVPVVVRLDAPLDKVYVRASGVPVPLSAVTTSSTVPAPTSLLREDGVPMVGARVHASEVPGLQRLFRPPAGIAFRVVAE